MGASLLWQFEYQRSLRAKCLLLNILAAKSRKPAASIVQEVSLLSRTLIRARRSRTEAALLRQAQLLQQVDVAGIAMPLIQRADDFDWLQAPGLFRSRLTQPGEGLLFVAEKGI